LHTKPFPAIEPVDAIDAGLFSFAPEHDEQSLVAEPSALIGKG
jgi:hypothetical protein